MGNRAVQYLWSSLHEDSTSSTFGSRSSDGHALVLAFPCACSRLQSEYESLSHPECTASLTGLRTWGFGLDLLWIPNWNARTTIGVRPVTVSGAPSRNFLILIDLVAAPKLRRLSNSVHL